MNSFIASLSKDRINEFCRRSHIRKLAFFGSVLRDDFTAKSDIDVLVEFEEGHIPGLAFFAIQEELSNMLGRNVDLNTPGFLNAEFREDVMKEAVIHYVAPQ